LDHIRESAERKHTQIFNMSGYAAPKLDTVRVGFIGVGSRGSGAVEQFTHIEGVDIKAVCDIQQHKADEAKKIVEGIFATDVYVGESEWQKVCERDDIDLIYICTHWNLHAPIALYAMEHGKHVAVEVPAALTVDECWQLVETSERTKKHCMMLENECYDRFHLLTLNMVRQGFFGDIIHVEGAYLHDNFQSLFKKDARWNYWRLRNNTNRNGALYPTHGMGPACQVVGINRGDKLNYMVSLSSNDFAFAPKMKELAGDPDFASFAGSTFRGNMNTTSIRTEKGRSMMIQHDYSSPRPYSSILMISGTKAISQKYPLPPKIAVGHNWMTPEEMKQVEDKYMPEIVRRIGTMAEAIGDHDGMDFLTNWRLVDCLRNGLPLDQDVYDAAAWSVIIPLSEWSVANKSMPIDFPDFTCGKWITNKEFDLTLDGGGTTKAIVSR
jgi:hypothetical protein